MHTEPREIAAFIAGKETKGAGTAGALITAVLVEEGPNSTRANIVTDLTVTGKAAQFGRGVMADVSKRLIDQFAGNLEQVIVARKGADVAAAAAAAGGETVVAAPAPAPVMNNEALDLGNAALVPVLKRVVPVVIGVVVIGGLIWWLVSR